MNKIHLISYVAVGLLVVACSNSPTHHHGKNNVSGIHSGSDRSAAAIPPTARARRQANPYPNSQGVSDEVRAANMQRERAFSAQPSSEDGYYATPHARSQVEREVAAENQSRASAFGYTGRQAPRPVDLGPGPGLSYISPNSAYDTEAQVYRNDNNYTRDSEPLWDASAPPLPDNAKPGQCFVLIERAPQYRAVTERIQTEPASNFWRSNCAPAGQTVNSTGQTACLMHDPARYQTVTRNVPVNEGGYEWRETPCQAAGNGHNVRNLQRALQRSGYNPGPIDGIFGQKTQRAAHAYQRDHGLARQAGMNITLLRKLGIR